jgi:hypothetical protein
MRAQGYTQLKQIYDIVKDIKTQLGWGWNHKKNITKVKDHVWSKYLKVDDVSLSDVMMIMMHIDL